MLVVEDLRLDMEKLVSIINRDRYTYLIFKFQQDELDSIEDKIKQVINRLINLIPDKINDELFNEILEMCELEEITETLNCIDRNGELVEVYKYNW